MKKTNLPLKIFSFLILATLACVTPWWALLVLLLASVVMFNSFYAAVLIGLEMDLLYGSSFEHGFPFLFTALMLVLVTVAPMLKRRLSFSDKLNY